MRVFWLCLGLVSVACGIAGAVLPLVPTTPFLLLAVYAFARSSPSLHHWLVTHRRFGPMIRAWHAHGAIARGTKRLAVGVMPFMLAASWYAGFSTLMLIIQGSVLSAAALFILTRPDAPPRQP